MPKIMILTHSNPAYIQALEKLQLPDFEILKKTIDNLSKADIWIAEPHIAAPLLPKAKSLKWIQSTFAGVNALVSKNKQQSFEITRINQTFGPLISEYVFSYILAKTRQHYHYRQLQRHSRWQTLPYEPLSAQTMLILGTGYIGQHLCKTAIHFGLNVIGINQHQVCPKPFSSVVSLEKLDDILPTADIVACCLPSNQDTTQLFDAERLKLLKSTASLINVGQGDLIDHQALLLHLSLHPASMAVLDVFEVEPLRESHPLWQCPNAIITPHIAAPSQISDVVEQFAENYTRFLNQEPLKNKINGQVSS